MERAETGMKPAPGRKPAGRKTMGQLGYASLFVLPGLILAAVFIFYPMIQNILISLSRYDLMANSLTFNSFENYKELLVNDQYHKFWLAYRNNLLYAAATVPATLFFALVSAILINSIRRGAMIFRFTYYLPVVTPWIVVGLAFTYLFNAANRGMVNYVLVDLLHVLPDYVNWLGNTWTGQFVIWLLGIWKNIGWAMVIYLASLQAVPADLYEAAGIEGGGWWCKFWHITLPMIMPTTFFLAVQLLIGAFNVFLQIFVMLPTDPTGANGSLQFLMYDLAFNNMEFGQGAAIGVLTAVSIFLIMLVLNRYLRQDRLVR